MHVIMLYNKLMHIIKKKENKKDAWLPEEYIPIKGR